MGMNNDYNHNKLYKNKIKIILSIKLIKKWFLSNPTNWTYIILIKDIIIFNKKFKTYLCYDNLLSGNMSS